jgi:acyl-coenzyme A thioesterase PaaI-like protein
MGEPLSLTHTVEQIRAEVLEPFNRLSFLTAVNARVEILDAERIRGTLSPIAEWQRGGLQSAGANGATLASILDLVLGVPGLIRAYPDARTATVQLSMSFMKLVEGDQVVADAWIARGSKAMLFTAAELRNGEGELCGQAQGVVRLMTGHRAPKAY